MERVSSIKSKSSQCYPHHLVKSYSKLLAHKKQGATHDDLESSATAPTRIKIQQRLREGAFFFFVFFKKNLQKYIFGFRFYSSIPLPSGRGAAGGLPPGREAVGTYM